MDSLGGSYSERFGKCSFFGYEVNYEYEIKPGEGRKVTAEMHLTRVGTHFGESDLRFG